MILSSLTRDCNKVKTSKQTCEQFQHNCECGLQSHTSLLPSPWVIFLIFESFSRLSGTPREDNDSSSWSSKGSCLNVSKGKAEKRLGLPLSGPHWQHCQGNLTLGSCLGSKTCGVFLASFSTGPNSSTTFEGPLSAVVAEPIRGSSSPWSSTTFQSCDNSKRVKRESSTWPRRQSVAMPVLAPTGSFRRAGETLQSR
jgi:hypothetical protein